MTDEFSRTELIFGRKAMERLFASKVAVFGIGGVGGYATEALARSGIGTLGLFDGDTVCPSNINRQIHATQKTVGNYKVDVARERILEINPEATVHAYKIFYLPETSAQVDLSDYDFVVDAIDMISGKIELALRAAECGVPIISSMAAGNKIDATAFEVADIYDTSICPIARVMRRELRRRGIEKLKVVYSKEPPLDLKEHSDCANGRHIPGSNAFVPAVAGMIIAGEVINSLAKIY